MLLDADESQLVLVDYQARLMPAIHEGPLVLANALRLAQMAQALRRDGARVVEAADGSEGLRRARRHRPDVIVLDLSLPGRDGFDVLLHLKRHRRLASVPVVVATGDTDGQLERKCRNAGGAAYLVKPHAPEDLSQVVMALAGLRDPRLEQEA